jgi:TonB family protein
VRRTIDLASASAPPRLLAQPSADVLRAAYPPQARKDGLESDVALKILVDVMGRVGAVRVVRGAGNGFDETAKRLVRSFRFRPGADSSGRPAAVWIPWTYKFRLNG